MALVISCYIIITLQGSAISKVEAAVKQEETTAVFQETQSSVTKDRKNEGLSAFQAAKNATKETTVVDHYSVTIL